MSGKYDDLEKLRDLYSKGIITEAEFNAEKAKILNDNREAGVNETTQTADNNNGYCSLMHLSQFSNFLFPGLGLIIPIVMWATRKNEVNLLMLTEKSFSTGKSVRLSTPVFW